MRNNPDSTSYSELFARLELPCSRSSFLHTTKGLENRRGMNVTVFLKPRLLCCTVCRLNNNIFKHFFRYTSIATMDIITFLVFIVITAEYPPASSKPIK